jgi:hypothetical protein
MAVVEEVKVAMAEGIYPQRIVQGSSGSYFCRNRAGVFLPFYYTLSDCA